MSDDSDDDDDLFHYEGEKSVSESIPFASFESIPSDDDDEAEALVCAAHVALANLHRVILVAFVDPLGTGMLWTLLEMRLST